MGMERPAVITANPMIAGLCRFDWAGPVTFYATDDWLAYTPYRQWWPVYEESFRRVRAERRRVCAVTPAALERVDPSGESLVLPNGLDPEEWQGSPAAPPAWSLEVDRPLLLYVGSLETRVDVPALAKLASELPDATIALVGPLLDPTHFEPLRALANVQFHEPVGREQVTSLIRQADVGLIPHVDSPLTRAMSPLKLYEYLAGGLPVVSADLSPVRGVSDRVTLVEVGGDYATGVRTALQSDRQPEQERLRFLTANSWRSRHEALLDLAFA
jgi:teichuronic acid biosynthesis glycosyltransferase TuaH